MVMTNDTLVFVSLMSVCFSILSDNDLITKPDLVPNNPIIFEHLLENGKEPHFVVNIVNIISLLLTPP